MLTKLKSIALIGIQGYQVEVQVDVTNNLPKWEIVGLPDASVREAKERVKAAIKNSGYELRSKKILINLAPAEIKKEGSAFELSIDLGYIKSKNISEYTFLGELSLDGKIKSISGILPMCIELKKLGLKKVILPKESAIEASIVNELDVYGVESLKETIDFLNGEKKIEKQENVKRALEIAAAGRT